MLPFAVRRRRILLVCAGLDVHGHQRLDFCIKYGFYTKVNMLNRPGIYKITNVIRGLVYVGSAIRVKSRTSNHKRALILGSHDNQRLQRSWTKYGPSAFEFAVLEYIDDVADLIQREQFFIDLLSAAKKPNFNICQLAGSSFGRLASDFTKTQMSIAHKGRRNSPAAIAKTMAAHIGAKRSPETRKKISDAKRGKPMHSATKAAIAAAFTNFSHSKE